MAGNFCSGMGGYVLRWPAIFAVVWAAMYRDGRLFLQWYGRLCGEMAGYFCSGMGGYVVRSPAIFAVVWAAM